MNAPWPLVTTTRLTTPGLTTPSFPARAGILFGGGVKELKGVLSGMGGEAIIEADRYTFEIGQAMGIDEDFEVLGAFVFKALIARGMGIEGHTELPILTAAFFYKETQALIGAAFLLLAFKDFLSGIECNLNHVASLSQNRPKVKPVI